MSQATLTVQVQVVSLVRSGLNGFSLDRISEDVMSTSYNRSK